MTPEPCTTWSHQRRHFSIDLTERAGGGRVGTVLCENLTGWDEDAINAVHRPWIKKRIVLADLPVCKRCIRKTGGVS